MRNKISTHIFASVLGVVVTGCLFSLLVLGTTTSKVEIMPDYGAVKLSSYKDESSQEEEIYRVSDTPVPKMEEITDIKMTELQMDIPSPDLKLAGLEMDFAPAIVGTAPLSGMPEMAEAGTLAAPSGGALTLSEVDEKPRALYAPSPIYPSGYRKNKKIKVAVRILINQRGEVERIIPRKVNAELLPYYKAAEEAISLWRFLPCRKRGKPVQCIAEQPVSFTYHK